MSNSMPDRFEHWREAIAGHVVGARLERASQDRFSAEVQGRMIGGLFAFRWASTGGWVHRTNAEIARSPASFYLAHIQLGGHMSVSTGRDREAVLPGDISFIDALRAFEFGGRTPSHCLAVLVPKEAIDARLARPDAVHGTVVRGARPVARILTRYVLSWYQSADDLTPAASAMVAAHTVEFFAEAIGEQSAAVPASTAARRDALFMQACRVIDLECGSAKLVPDRIAQLLGISRRLLHRIFAERGETVMRRVFARRVGYAANLLAAPDARHRSITEIAFACGFSDSAHFTRAFAARMQMPPSEWRKRSLS